MLHSVMYYDTFFTTYYNLTDFSSHTTLWHFFKYKYYFFMPQSCYCRVHTYVGPMAQWLGSCTQVQFFLLFYKPTLWLFETIAHVDTRICMSVLHSTHLNTGLTSVFPLSCSLNRRPWENVSVKRLCNQPITLRQHRPLVCLGYRLCVRVGVSEWDWFEGVVFFREEISLQAAPKLIVFHYLRPFMRVI